MCAIDRRFTACLVCRSHTVLRDRQLGTGLHIDLGRKKNLYGLRYRCCRGSRIRTVESLEGQTARDTLMHNRLREARRAGLTLALSVFADRAFAMIQGFNGFSRLYQDSFR